MLTYVTLKYFGIFRREMPILSQHCCLANSVNTLFVRNLWTRFFCHFVFVPRNDCLRVAVVWHKCQTTVGEERCQPPTRAQMLWRAETCPTLFVTTSHTLIPKAQADHSSGCSSMLGPVPRWHFPCRSLCIACKHGAQALYPVDLLPLNQTARPWGDFSPRRFFTARIVNYFFGGPGL